MPLINFAFCHSNPVPDNLTSKPAVCTPKVRLNCIGLNAFGLDGFESVITTEFAAFSVLFVEFVFTGFTVHTVIVRSCLKALIRH